MSIQIKVNLNDIPHYVLSQLDTHRAVLVTSEKNKGKVFVSTSLKPADLREIGNLEALSGAGKDEKVYSITVVTLKLDNELIGEAVAFIDNPGGIISELETLLEDHKDVYLVYVVTHYNPGQKPCGPLTINIGGDCYRNDEAIKDFKAVLKRTRDLSEAMLSKAVMVFPDIPALHGGKKGEWIVLDCKGEKLHGISDEAIIALGSVIIPAGIIFLNKYKEIEARETGIFENFPASGYVFPDSGSPDVLSGIFWRGENKAKQINLCETWSKRGIDMRNFTCLPENLNGTRDSSSRPTGYGVATTAVELTKRFFTDYKDRNYLIEAAGGVGQNTIEALTQKYGVKIENITIFDKADGACKFVESKFPGLKTVSLPAEEFYKSWLPENNLKYDVWINNGEGDNMEPAGIDELIKAGVKIFCGGANNFLQVNSKMQSLDKIFESGGWAFPDPATSAGGWTLAVMDMVARSKGERAGSPEITEKILETIISRNKNLIDAVFNELPENPTGRDIWEQVDKVIGDRVKKTLAVNFTPAEIFEKADARNWNI